MTMIRSSVHKNDRKFRENNMKLKFKHIDYTQRAGKTR